MEIADTLSDRRALNPVTAVPGLLESLKYQTYIRDILRPTEPHTKQAKPQNESVTS